jgi:hypothetical protein
MDVFSEVNPTKVNQLSLLITRSKPMPSLLRLFPRESDPSQRFSSADPTIIAEGVGGTPIDPWRVLMDVGSQSQDGFSRSLQWLCTFARSGVDVPVSIFERFSFLAVDFHASLADSMLLVESLLASSWLKPTNRHQLQNILASLHSRLLSHILECLAAGVHVPLVYISFTFAIFAH